MSWTPPFFWIAFAVFWFWVLGAHNRLTRLRAAVVQSFGSLDAHLVRMVALVGEFGAAQAVHRASTSRDICGAEHHQIALQNAMTQLSALLAVVRASPLQGNGVADLSAARNAMHASWHSAAYPPSAIAGLAGADLDPKGYVDTTGRSCVWQIRWDEHVLQNDQATHVFNDAVSHYNVAITQFPANLLAKVFGFKTVCLLQPIFESR